MSYPGGKSGAGVYQAIINQMPWHLSYVEPFLGHGSVMRHKKPAEYNQGRDLSQDAVTSFLAMPAVTERGKWVVGPSGEAGLLDIQVGDGIKWLKKNAYWMADKCLVYCDPPYPMESRSGRKLYDFEMTRRDHIRLLQVIKSLSCMVMISSYENDLYNEQLSTWRKITFTGQTRGGPRTECLWMNYAEPMALHDYSYLGNDFRERERIKRKVTRWKNNLEAMPEDERRAMVSALSEVVPAASPQLSMLTGRHR